MLDLDMNTDLRAQGEDMWLSLGREPTAARAVEVMTHNYGLMPQAFLPHLSRMVDALLAQDASNGWNLVRVSVSSADMKKLGSRLVTQRSMAPTRSRSETRQQV